MYIQKHQNAAGSKISVTNTATGIFDLINTAASTALAYAGFTSTVNAIDIMPEDGDVRVLFDGNTPTSSNGVLLSQGVLYSFRGVPLKSLKLIRAGSSNVACGVQIGLSEAGESSSAVATSVSLEAGALTLGNVEIDGYTSMTSGSKVVATAGSPETLVGSSTPCKRVDVTAYIGNAGNVAIGGSSVDASPTLGTGNGVILEAGDSYTMYIEDVQKVYLDVLNNGDGVRFNYFN